jgi:hypothetical protein
MRRVALHVVVATALVVSALLAVGGSLSGAPNWSPDGLFYQARVYELQGMERQAALERAFQGPLGAELRREDPARSGDPGWVRYNAQFYDRRMTVPLAAAAFEPIAGDRAILDISLAGYIAAVLALFGLLLLRFRLPIAAGVSLAAVFLPALTHHASYPLTDSWGLALQTAALACGLLVLDRGRRWLVPWTAAILVLSFTRDSTWIPVLASLWLMLDQRSRVAISLFVSGLAASLPAMLAFQVPLRELLAQMLNEGVQPQPDTPWSSIAGDYPGAIVDLLQADGGFVHDGAWYSAAFLAGGVLLLFLLARGRHGSPATTLLKAAAAAGVAYVLVVPVFSAFRLDLVLVPMAAFGLALGAERLAERASVALPLRAPAAVTHD